jgi:uncharacterized protein (DUF2235 family)
MLQVRKNCCITILPYQERHRFARRTEDGMSIRPRVALGPSWLVLALLPLVSGTLLKAESAPPPSGERRLVVLLDGTLNSPEEGKLKKDARHPYPSFEPTNVLKLYRAVLPVAADGASQISFYSDGVGSFIGDPAGPGKLLVAMDRFYGGVAGTGYEERVKSAYRFLVGNYRPGDQIFIFGFSRGAAEARTLAVFMDWAGGLLHKNDEYYIPELFIGWQGERGQPGAAAAWFKKRYWIHRPQPAEVIFLGVFDTVISLGFRMAADFQERDVPTVGPKYEYYVDKTPPPSVKTARQALAIDEHRWDFRPQVWRGPAAGRPPESLAQMWFPGVHSNVGGGYPRDALAYASMVWLISEAHAAGLDVDCGHLGQVIKRQSTVYQTDTGAYRVWEWLRGKAGRGIRVIDAGAEARVHVHASAGARLLADSNWRPANLLAYLAADETRIGDFTAADQDCIRELVEAFKQKVPNWQPSPACAAATLPEPATPAFCPAG